MVLDRQTTRPVLFCFLIPLVFFFVFFKKQLFSQKCPVPAMVEVLGPWLVPVEAVVSEPTAGARMKSMSPSVEPKQESFGLS